MILAVTYNNTLYCAIASRRAGRFNMYPAMLYVYLIIIFSIILASFSFSFVVVYSCSSCVNECGRHRTNPILNGQLVYKTIVADSTILCKCVSEALYIEILVRRHGMACYGG